MMTLCKVNTLEQTREVLASLEALSQDVTLPAKDISNLSLDGMYVPDLGQVKFTPDASCQLAAKAGIPTRTFKWLCDNQPEQAQLILEDQWNGFVNGSASKNVLIRAREVDGAMHCRAVLSDRYGIIDSLSLVEALIKMLPEHLDKARVGGLKPSVWIDKVSGAFSFKGVLGEVGYTSGKEKHTWGICGGNDECGRGSAIMDLLYGRVFCTNQFTGLGLGRNRRSHITGKDGIEKFREQVNVWMGDRLQKAEETMQSYWQLQGKELTQSRAEEVLVEFGQKVGLPKGELIALTKDMLPKYVDEVGCTAYAVVNSLTHFAKEMEDRARQQMWETAAGQMVGLFR